MNIFMAELIVASDSENDSRKIVMNKLTVRYNICSFTTYTQVLS